MAWLSDPPVVMFDERYYVSAAQTILGHQTPADAPYQAAPGLDPNREHPPLAKLAIAASVKLLGDTPVGWRLPSVVFGSGVIMALYWLVRSAGGSAWLAVGTASVMAADNLFLVHGRIATLDVFVLAFMLVGTSLYLRGRPLLAGVVIGIGACTKLVGFFALPVILVFEVLVRTERSPSGEGGVGGRPRLRQAASCCGLAVVAYLGMMTVLDATVTPFGNPVSHTRYMLGYASGAPSPADRDDVSTASAATQPAAPLYRFAESSQPWEWLANRKPITYYERLEPDSRRARVQVAFQGRMNPFVIFLAGPALLAIVWAWRRERDRITSLALAWLLGVFVPLLIVGLRHRANYLYYMLLVLPGICLAIARLFASPRLPSVMRYAYGIGLVYGICALYPFRTWGVG